MPPKKLTKSEQSVLRKINAGVRKGFMESLGKGGITKKKTSKKTSKKKATRKRGPLGPTILKRLCSDGKTPEGLKNILKEYRTARSHGRVAYTKFLAKHKCDPMPPMGKRYITKKK